MTRGTASLDDVSFMGEYGDFDPTKYRLRIFMSGKELPYNATKIVEEWSNAVMIALHDGREFLLFKNDISSVGLERLP